MAEIIEIIRETIIAPRAVAKRINEFNLKNNTIFEALVLVVTVSTLITFGSLYVQLWVSNKNSVEFEPIFTIFSKFPLILAVTQILIIILFSFLVTVLGKFFKGKGSFFDVLKNVIWINFILVILNIVQLLLILVSSQLSALLGITGTLWSMWAISAAAAEIHGFKSTFLTAIGGAVLILIMLLVFGIFLQSFGFFVFKGILNV